MEQDNVKYTVDFKNVHYYSEIHKALKEGMYFPGYYGENLDALWDCLTETVGNNVEIVIQNYQDIEKINKEYAEKILTIFKRAKKFADGLYSGTRIYVERNGVITEIE